MTEYQPPRGTRDFIGKEMSRRQYIIDSARKVFESYGFRQMDTPAFESWELLCAKGGGGDAVKDEIYYFRDKSDRELGLRFDLTVPLARVVANNPQMQLPFKRYQVGKVWRYDRPQAGRMREFLQMDPDIIGAAGMEADAECIAAAAETLKKLGFSRFRIRLNNRKVLNGMVEYAGIKKNQATGVFRILDKLEKISRKEIKSELVKAGVTDNQIKKLMKLIETSGSPSSTIKSMRKMLGGVAGGEEGLDELERIVQLSGPYGFGKNLVVDFSLVRGLDYYTGPIFEITVKARKSVGSVSGGGRYDKLIGLYGGRDTPATGISLGIERIYEIMRTEGMFGGEKDKSLFVVAVNSSVSGDAMSVAKKIRDAGVFAETDIMGRSLRKQLEYAGKKGIRYALIVGPKELKTGKYTFRDMETGRESKTGIESIIRKLS